MRIKLLYLYLYEREKMSPEETAELSNYFTSCKKANKHIVDTDKLTTNIPVYTNESLEDNLKQLNKEYHYYSDKQLNQTMIDRYKTYLRVLILICLLHPERDQSQNRLLAYTMLVIFGTHKNEKSIFEALDTHADINQEKGSASQRIDAGLSFPLVKDPRNASLELEKWQTLIHDNISNPLSRWFGLALPIQLKLNRCPSSIAEAIEAAEKLTFENQSQAPTLAELLVKNYLPESLFNLALSEKEEDRIKAFKEILSLLDPQFYTGFIKALPTRELTLNEAIGNLELLGCEEKTFYLYQFNDLLKLLCTNANALRKIFCVCHHYQQQNFLMILIKKEKMIGFTANIDEFIFLFKSIKNDSQYLFLKNDFGIKNLNLLFKTRNDYLKFLQHCLPKDHQVDFIKNNIIPPDKDNVLDTELTTINGPERVAYLQDIITAPVFISTIRGDSSKLRTYLEYLPENDRYPFIVRFDKTQVRAWFKNPSYELTCQKLYFLIPPGMRSELDTLINISPEEEAKQDCEYIKVKLNELANKSSHQTSILDFIQKAQDTLMTYNDARQAIADELNKAIYKQSFSSSITRRTDTNRIYKHLKDYLENKKIFPSSQSEPSRSMAPGYQ